MMNPMLRTVSTPQSQQRTDRSSGQRFVTRTVLIIALLVSIIGVVVREQWTTTTPSDIIFLFLTEKVPQEKKNPRTSINLEDLFSRTSSPFVDRSNHDVPVRYGVDVVSFYFLID
jgi:hypothetical protein